MPKEHGALGWAATVAPCSAAVKVGPSAWPLRGHPDGLPLTSTPHSAFRSIRSASSRPGGQTTPTTTAWEEAQSQAPGIASSVPQSYEGRDLQGLP